MSFTAAHHHLCLGIYGLQTVVARTAEQRLLLRCPCQQIVVLHPDKHVKLRGDQQMTTVYGVGSM